MMTASHMDSNASDWLPLPATKTKINNVGQPFDKINNFSSKRRQSGQDQDNSYEEKAEVDYLNDQKFVPPPVKLTETFPHE